MSSIDSISSEGNVTDFIVGQPLVITAYVLNDDLTTPAQLERVTWSVEGDASLNQYFSFTDNDGYATTTITATMAGNIMIKSVTSTDTTGQTLSLQAKAPGDIYIVGTRTSDGSLPNDKGYADAGYYITVTASVADLDETEVEDVDVTWSVVDSKGTSLSEFVSLKPVGATPDAPDVSVTDRLGEASVRVIIENEFSSPVPSEIKVIATVEGKQAPTEQVIKVILGSDLGIPPEIIGANASDDYIIDKADIANGVVAIISPVINNNTYTFYWGDQYQEKFPQDIAGNQAITFDINKVINEPFTEGNHTALYIHRDVSNNPTYSRSVPVMVLDAGQTPATLPRPIIAASDADGTINIADAVSGVTLVVEESLDYGFEILKDDIITLYFSVVNDKNELIPGTDFFEGYTANDDSVKKHTFTIPLSFLQPNGRGIEGKGRAYYYLDRAGNKRQLSVENNPFVDTLAP